MPRIKELRGWMLGALALAGCTHTQVISMPPQLKADRWTVDGNIALFTPKVSFGPYTLKARIYGSQNTSGATIFNGNTEKLEDTHKGSFELPTASGAFHAECVKSITGVVKHETSYGLEGKNGKTRVVEHDQRELRAASASYRCVLHQPGAEDAKFQFIFGESGRVYGGGVDLTISELAALQQPAELAAGVDSGYALLEGERVVAVIGHAQPAVGFGTPPVSATVTLVNDVPQRQRDTFAAVAAELVMLRDMN